jgi:hypothetical protein
MIQTFYDKYDTYTQLAAFYIAARLFTAGHYALTAFFLPLVKGFMYAQVVLILIPVAIWIGSTQVAMPVRLALIFTALAIDLFGQSLVVVPFTWALQHSERKAAKRIDRLFEFYPAMNIEHRVERTNAFVSLVIGWAVVALLYQNAKFGVNAFLGKAIMGLVQAFVFNWIYFELDGENIHTHAIRRSAPTAIVWNFAHLPFICAYTLSSAAMSQLVVAADGPGAGDPATLYSDYAERSKDTVSSAMRWLYCAGLAVSLLCMGIINATHVHKKPNAVRVPKRLRLANRAAVCIIFVCLPFATSLSSTNLVAITMCLMIWVLLLEIWGTSCPEDTFCGGGSCKLKYQARCSKKRLEEELKQVEQLDVVEVPREEKTAVECPG